MRYAIVSDIHANWQAWTAVRDDIAMQGVECVLCLGDVIGYGPQPQRVLDDVLTVVAVPVAAAITIKRTSGIKEGSAPSDKNALDT